MLKRVAAVLLHDPHDAEMDPEMKKLRCSQRGDNRELCKSPGVCGGLPQGSPVRWGYGGSPPGSSLGGGGKEPETGRHHGLIPPHSAGCTVRVT